MWESCSVGEWEFELLSCFFVGWGVCFFWDGNGREGDCRKIQMERGWGWFFGAVADRMTRALMLCFSYLGQRAGSHRGYLIGISRFRWLARAVYVRILVINLSTLPCPPFLS
jgi:hypothetical protein